MSGTVHLASVTTELGFGYRLAQGSEIQIDFNNNLDVAYHIDGEPTMLNQCSISITHAYQTPMLKKSV